VQQVDESGYSDEDKPEPDEQEYLLIEQVDRQHTLHRVAMNIHETHVNIHSTHWTV